MNIRVLKLNGEKMTETKIMKVSYTGKITETGTVFDTSDEKIAKKNNIYNPNRPYGATTMILGEKRLIKGVENALKQMKEKETKTVNIKPNEAYGERTNELIKLIPLNVFKKNNIHPFPGMVVQLDNNLQGKVQSVSGGRVRVDLNHELAGKELTFDLKVEKIAKTDEDIANALFDLTFQGIDKKDLKIDIKNKTKTSSHKVMTPEEAVHNKKTDPKNADKEIIITMPQPATKLQDYQARKVVFSNDLKKYLNADKVKINEEY